MSIGAMLNPLQLADLRQTCLSWAVSTAKSGEKQQSILERAQAYLDFIIDPLVSSAVMESREAPLQ